MPKKLTLRNKTYQILERESHSTVAKIVHYFLMLLIFLTVIAVILESDPDIYNRYQNLFYVLEILAIVVFSIEYILRVWSSAELKKYQSFNGKIKYMLTPMAIIDLLAVLPALFGLFISRDLMILRGLRLIRVFKLTRYSRSMNLLLSVSRQESGNILSVLFVLSLLIIIAATGMYIVERDIQPEAFGTIPKAIWWATVTLTTVGYGDMVPISPQGRIFGILILISGIAMAALPAGILAAGFTKEVNRRKEIFRRRVIDYLADGVIDRKEKRKLRELAYELSISTQDASAVIWELNHAQIKESKLTCPHCDTTIHVEHSSSGHIKIK
jgi:voltage-gated potassium channel